jgi:hypothetical protein
MTDDTRTPEQHMADIAACTLNRLARLRGELDSLQGQLERLVDYGIEHDLFDSARIPVLLGDTIESLTALGCCVPTAVRDIASVLPIRGLEYGETVTDEAP